MDSPLRREDSLTGAVPFRRRAVKSQEAPKEACLGPNFFRSRLGARTGPNLRCSKPKRQKNGERHTRPGREPAKADRSPATATPISQ